MTTITARDAMRDQVLAQGALDSDVVELEGAYYFDPEHVDMSHLVVTQRTYTCPYKGKCLWIDLQTDTGVIKDVGWVYTEPRAGYEYIQDKIGFAYGMRPGVIVKKFKLEG